MRWRRERWSKQRPAGPRDRGPDLPGRVHRRAGGGADAGPPYINAVIYPEMSIRFSIVEALEGALNTIEDIGDVVESIVLKHA